MMLRLKRKEAYFMDKKGVLITVVIAVKNMVDTVERTILSVLNQTYSNKELIIMDCESTDGTVDVIRKYEKQLKYWVSASDNGPSDAISKALEYADGKLIGFLGADDWYESYALEKVAKKYSLTEGDLYYGNMCVHYADHIEVKDLNVFSPDKLFSDGTQWLGAVCAFAKKNLLIENYKKDNNFLLTDFLFFLRLYVENKRFVHIGCSEPITHFNIGGRTTTMINEVAIDAYCVRQQVMKEYPNAWEKYDVYMPMLWENYALAVLELHKDDWMREEFENEIKELIQISGDEKYILFGSGNRGLQCLELLNWLGAQVECFVDNNSNLWKKRIDNLVVEDSNYLNTIHNRTIIVTPGNGIAEQIMEQLRHMGVIETNRCVTYSEMALSIFDMLKYEEE